MKSKINHQSLYQSIFSLRLITNYIAALILLFGVGAEAFAQAGNFTTIDPPGSVNTYTSEINNSGEVVGHYTDANNKGRGFKWSNGVFTIIDVPGSVDTKVFGINDSGDVVGNSSDANNRLRGFKWSNGVFTII